MGFDEVRPKRIIWDEVDWDSVSPATTQKAAALDWASMQDELELQGTEMVFDIDESLMKMIRHSYELRNVYYFFEENTDKPLSPREFLAFWYSLPNDERKNYIAEFIYE